MRKSLYELSRLHAGGLLSREDYLETRRALLVDILSGRQPLEERHYPTLSSPQDSTVHYTSTDIQAQRRDARLQYKRIQEFRDYARTMRHARRVKLLRIMAAVLLVLGVAGSYVWTQW